MPNVVMIETRLGENGTPWRAGNTYSASESFAKALIGRGDAYAADYSLPDVALTAQQVGAVAAAAPQRYAVGLGLFGDSITNNGYFTTGTAPEGGTPAPYFVRDAVENFARSWGWSTWLGPLSMQRIQVVRSWARQTNGLLVAGTGPVGYPLSVQVTTALSSAEWAKVTRAVIMIGTNDGSTQRADGSYSTPQECATELLTQIARIGKPVTLISAPPSNTGTTTVVGDSLRYWAWLLQWRAICKRIADDSGGFVQFVDGYSLGNTPTAAADVLVSTRTYDNIHPNNAYAYLIADAVVSSILPSGIGGDLDLWPSNTSAATTGATLMDQGFANPTLGTASGGSGTGTVAGSLTITNIATATHSGSVAANTMTGGTGNMQSIAVTSNANGDGVDVATASFHAAGGTFLSAGDVAWGQMLIRINSGGIYPRNLFFRLQGFQSPTNYNALLWELDAAKEIALPLTATRTFLLRTPLLTMPAGAAFSNLAVKLRATFAGAGSCTIDIGNIECRRFRVGGLYS